MARTTYTDDEKAHALALYREHGPAEASRQSGIPEGTIKSWANRAGLQPDAPENLRAAVEAAKLTNEQKRQARATQLARLHDLALERELALIGDTGDLAKLTAARKAALHDLQLLSGEATTRTESLTIDALDRQIMKLERELAAQ